MSDKIETIEYRGYEIEVCYDTDAGSPDEWGDDDCFLVYDHRQFSVKRKGFDPEDILDHCNENKRMFYDGYYVFPLYAYIHSGVSLSLGRSGYPFTCPWDTSMSGFVLVHRTKGWSWKRNQAEKIAESVVEGWNQYLSGEVYGYNSEIGGCWGFYGDEGRKRMIEDAKGEIDFYIKRANEQIIKDHFNKMRTWITNRVPLYVRQPLQLN